MVNINSNEMLHKVLILLIILGRLFDFIRLFDYLLLYYYHSHLISLFSGTGKIGLLSLLGFDNTSPITIFHNKLPYILATLVNGLSDPVIDDRIITLSENNTKITCSVMFEWWSYVRIGLSSEEYKILKDFTCNLDPENFNVYMDFYMTEVAIWQKPTKKYRSYIFSVLGDLYELAKAIGITIKNNIVVEPPFSTNYLKDFPQKLKESLEVTYIKDNLHRVNR